MAAEGEYEEGDSGDDSDGGQATTQMDPLELRFSQRKMRNVFMDGRLIDDSIPQVNAVRRSAEDAKTYGAHWRLEAPFPPVEVCRFRCKLRDETTGRPLIDPETRQERFEAEESWFTLDNRRLYCLQKAAVKLLPERCTVDAVAEIRKERRLREIRKFRTLDNGKSIEVGSVVDGVPFETWSWSAAAEKAADKGSSGSKGRGGGKGKAQGSSGASAGKSASEGKSADGKAGGRKGKGSSKGFVSYTGDQYQAWNPAAGYYDFTGYGGYGDYNWWDKGYGYGKDGKNGKGKGKGGGADWWY